MYDPTYLVNWKVAYLQQAHRDFRSAKNARERGDISYSDWQVEVHDGPQYVNVTVDEDQIRLHVFERLSFVEIAREGLPGPHEGQHKPTLIRFSRRKRWQNIVSRSR